MSGSENAGAQRLEVNPDVIFRRVEEEVVLVRVSTNEIYRLNPSGARVWELVGDGGQLDEVVTQLAAEYGEPESTLRPQIETFIEDLQHQGFLQP